MYYNLHKGEYFHQRLANQCWSAWPPKCGFISTDAV